SPMRSSRSSSDSATRALRNFDQVRHLGEHSADLGGVLVLDAVADATQPERAQRLPLALVRPVARPALGDGQLAHASDSSASASASGSGDVASAALLPFGLGAADTVSAATSGSVVNPST